MEVTIGHLFQQEIYSLSSSQSLERKSRGERISLTGFKMKEEEQPQATFAVIRSIVMMEFANNQVI